MKKTLIDQLIEDEDSQGHYKENVSLCKKVCMGA